MNPRQIFPNLFNRELVRVVILLSALLVFFFADVVFGRATFLTSTFTFLPNTMPEGPYGYTGHRTASQPTRDSGASAWHTEPLNRLSARMIKSGQLPLWNPHAGAGVPLAANMQSGALYPPNALIFLFPDNAWEWMNNFFTLIGFFIAGLFTWLFLRRIGVSAFGAVGAAVAYMFCGRLTFYIGTADWRVDTLIPFLMWATERFYLKPNGRSALMVAVAVFLEIAAGMPESTFFALLLASLYYVYRAFADWFRAPRQLIARLVPFTLATLLGIAFSAYLIVPFVEYVMTSWNAHASGTGIAIFHPDSIISIIVPYFWGAVLQGWHYPYLGETMPYIGVTVALLALYAFARGTALLRHAYFFGALAILFLLKAFGAPFVQWISYLPLFSISIFPRFAGAAFMFSTTTLAGIGLDNVLQQRVSLRRAWIGVAMLASVIVGFTAAFGQEILAKNQVEYVGLQIGIALGLLAASLCAFALRARAAWLLGGLVAVELFIALPKDRVDKYDPFTTPPFVHFLLQEEPAPFRVLGLDRILYPVTAGVYGLDDIRNLDALYPKRYPTFIKRFVDPDFNSFFSGQDTVLQTKFLDLLNVRYFLSVHPLLDRWQSADLMPRFAEQCDAPKACAGYSTTQVNDGIILQVNQTASADMTMRVPSARPFLRVEVSGDGAYFELRVRVQDNSRMLFAKSLDSNARSWEANVIDLAEFADKNITLTFSARCQTQCAWRKIELIEPREEYARALMTEFLPLKQDLVSAQQGAIWIYDDEVRIYKNESAFPRAFVIHDAVAAASEQDALEKIASPDFDPRRQVVIEGIRADLRAPAPQTDDFAAPKIVERSAGYVAIDVAVEQPGFLVLTDSDYPGWKARVDGKGTDLVVADYLFRAVQLERGAHRVEFVYDPLSYKIGFLITLCALVAGIFASVYFHHSEN